MSEVHSGKADHEMKKSFELEGVLISNELNIPTVKETEEISSSVLQQGSHANLSYT
jgi:hypothetical protein